MSRIKIVFVVKTVFSCARSFCLWIQQHARGVGFHYPLQQNLLFLHKVSVSPSGFFCVGKSRYLFCDGIAIIVFRDAPVPAEDGGRPRRHEVIPERGKELLHDFRPFSVGRHTWARWWGAGRGRKWAGRGGNTFCSRKGEGCCNIAKLRALKCTF